MEVRNLKTAAAPPKNCRAGGGKRSGENEKFLAEKIPGGRIKKEEKGQENRKRRFHVTNPLQ